MLTLAAAETVAGVAGAATITCTLFGMELAAGVETYKKLSQGVLSNSGAATVYTTPASTQTFVKSIHLANTSSTAVTGVSLYTKGLLAANRLMGSINIPANGWAVCGEDGWRIYDQNGALQSGLVVGLSYKFNSATSGDPGSGHFGFDNATFSSASVLRISRTTADGFVIASHLQAVLNAVPKCTGVMKSTDGSKIFNFLALGTSFFVDNGTYYSIQITPWLGSSGIVNDQAFSAEFFLYGVNGAGVPTGGVFGQFLKKNSSTDFDTSWFDLRNPLLTADATYYIRTDGNDANTGLVNSSAGAFLTLQKAIDTVSKLDAASFKITLQLADGTYASAGNVLKNITGFSAPGNLVIRGNNTTPANVVISTTGGCFTSNGLFCVWDILDLKLTSSTSHGILAKSGGNVRIGNLVFVTASYHMVADGAGVISALSNYTIAGNAQRHWYAVNGGLIDINSSSAPVSVITLTGTPAFSIQFAGAFGPSTITCYGITFTGSATGSRYEADNGGYIFTNGGGANYLPGNAAGGSLNGHYA